MIRAFDATRAPFLLIALSAILLASTPFASAQRGGEYLTDEEMEAVRSAQVIDARTLVFMKIADRRLLAITNPQATLDKKELKVFGPLPTGSQIDLLDDYRRTIDELMDKIDDSYSHTGKSKEFVKAMDATRVAAERQLKDLDALRDRLTSEDARQFRNKAVDSAKLLLEGIAGVMAADEAKPKE
jgi:hypothetical protein